MKILAILQNQWFKNPEIAERMYARRPDLRNEYIRRFLFMGCRTGQVLQQVFGEDLCRQIVWEEASPKIAGMSSGVFPADPEHIRKAIDRHKPDVILCFGKVARDGVKALDLSIPVHCGPHPTARQNPLPALRAIADEVKQQV
jgi:hypothetical protein